MGCIPQSCPWGLSAKPRGALMMVLVAPAGEDSVLFRHLPQDMAGRVPADLALPSGPSLLSGRGLLALPAQEGRWRGGHGCQTQDPSTTFQSHQTLKLQFQPLPAPFGCSHLCWLFLASHSCLVSPFLLSSPSLHDRSGRLSLPGVQENPDRRIKG